MLPKGPLGSQLGNMGNMEKKLLHCMQRKVLKQALYCWQKQTCTQKKVRKKERKKASKSLLHILTKASNWYTTRNHLAYDSSAADDLYSSKTHYWNWNVFCVIQILGPKVGHTLQSNYQFKKTWSCRRCYFGRHCYFTRKQQLIVCNKAD